VDQQSPQSARQGPSALVRDYRRGLEYKGGQKQWQKHWHFNDKCESYPTGAFIVRKDRPSDDDLCSRCERASSG
jgi:hypothetical protein